MNPEIYIPTHEENIEKYGDCCEVNYQLIEEDRLKSFEKFKEEMRFKIEKMIDEEGHETFGGLQKWEFYEELGL